MKWYNKKYFKAISVFSSCGFIGYNIVVTCKKVHSIVNTNVLQREKRTIPEYIYIDEPAYDFRIPEEEIDHKIGTFRVWKNIQRSLAWKLLWVCRHGNHEQRERALQQLASIKTLQHWEGLKLAQAMDEMTAVLLARTEGADPRCFLLPPIHVRRAALSSQVVSFKLRDLIKEVNRISPHSCITHFLSKYFTIQNPAVEVDSVPTKPSTISEKELCVQCLDALHHHITLFYCEKYEEDLSTKLLVSLGLLNYIAELFLRYHGDAEVEYALLRLMTILSGHKELLMDFHQNGLIGQLARLIKSKHVRLSSSATVCLGNLSGEENFKPGLFLLHPIYRKPKNQTCDILLVHGLQGGVFVTWRQRDRKPNAMHEPTEDATRLSQLIADAEMRQAIEEMLELENEILLNDIEVVLHDLPISTKREENSFQSFTTKDKHLALQEEDHDRSTYTYCWPKDWLPQDCKNLRILGVNYWSSLSEWLESCPLLSAEIATKAAELGPSLVDTGVGSNGNAVVWLAHSMGGLIVKQILLDSSQSSIPEFRQISENTKALLFYSTPHKGSPFAKMPRAASAIFWPSSDVTQLQYNSPVLLELNEKFLNLACKRKWEIVSFSEGNPTLVTAFKVPIHFVEKESADIGYGVHYEMPLDHLSICKPATRQSVLYKVALDVIQRSMVEEEPVNFNSFISNYIQSFIEWLSIIVYGDSKCDKTQ